MVAEPLTPTSERVSRSRNQLWRSARVCNEFLYLSADLYERLGRPRFVGVKIGRQHAALALRAAERRLPGGGIHTISRMSGGTVRVCISAALSALDRTRNAVTTELPHRWVGDTLIVDVSPLPLAGGS